MRQSLPIDSVRWTRPEHSHLTLRFLGDVRVDRIDDLAERLRITCCNFAPLNVRVERIGFFPLRGFPRVIWTAVSDKEQHLARLQTAIQSETLPFTSEPADKQFTSHITLGRAKKLTRRGADALAGFAENMRGRVFGEWQVRSVDLFRSELSADGPHHTVIHTIPLNNTR